MRLLKIAFWPVLAATLIVYAIMLAWSLPTIASAAGGLDPFDMRPAGYTFAEAKAFLAALPPDQTTFYRDIQVGLLDAAYPALLGLTLFLAIGLLGLRRLGFWAWALALVAIPGAVFDYMENVNVQLMLFLGPENINAEIVARASSRTVMKAMFTTAAMSVLLVLIALWAWKRFVPTRN